MQLQTILPQCMKTYIAAMGVTQGVLAPRGGKKLVAVIDDLHLACGLEGMGKPDTLLCHWFTNGSW